MELCKPNGKFPQDLYIVSHYTPTPTARICMCGITYPSNKYEHPNVLLPHYVFEYIASGKGHITVNSQTYTVTEGDITIIKRDSLVSFASDKNDPYLRLFFCPYGPLVDTLCSFFEISSPVHIKHNCPEARKYFEELFYSLRDDTYNEELCNNTIFNVISKATNIVTDFALADTLDIADKIYHYIQQNFVAITSLDDICREFHTSKSHIIHQYKKKFGVSPYHVIMEKKLRLASDLLRHSLTPVNDIAEELHFNSTSNFIKQFRTRFGVTPSKYRKYNNEKKENN